MKVVIDIECNALENPSHIWVIVCKDIDTGKYYIFRNVIEDEEQRTKFIQFSKGVVLWIGHNFLEYDFPVLSRLTPYRIQDVARSVRDTLIISRMVNYSRPGGHSINSYGEEFGIPKGKGIDFSHYSQEMEDYCVRDVDICYRIYSSMLHVVNDVSWDSSLALEHAFQLVVNGLADNGFAFNNIAASSLLTKVTKELEGLDVEITKAFPKQTRPIREIVPRYTRYGTLHKGDFRWVKSGDLSEFNGGPFCRFEWAPFNPNSHLQIVSVLNSSGWSPTDRTAVHIETEREINRLKYQNKQEWDLDVEERYGILKNKLEKLKKTGWKVNETNLNTLPTTAPRSARSLAKRILYESRRRTLTEWLGLFRPETGRIHGSFYGLGAWTHRMSHQKPNLANIPNEFKTDGTRTLLGKELRSLWRAGSNRQLVGVDAESIQLRIFAHYIDDKEFTEALVKGNKDDHTDPHSLNQRILGKVCKSRAAAKRFIYALLLGAGLDKLAEVLGCSRDQAQSALDRLMERYQGFKHLKETLIPVDARRGYFSGIDGRRVAIPGETVGQRKHLCMSGYLQNGEAVVVKRAAVQATEAFTKLPEAQATLVDVIHDEFQAEAKPEYAGKIAQILADAIKEAGEYYKLKCPMAGSYWDADHRRYTIGENWSLTH